MKQVCWCLRHQKTALPRKMPSEQSHKEDALQMVLKIYFFGKLGAFAMFTILADIFFRSLCVLLGTGQVPLLTCLVTSAPVLPRPHPSLSLAPMGPPLAARATRLSLALRAPLHCPPWPWPLPLLSCPFRPSPPVSPSLGEARGHQSVTCPPAVPHPTPCPPSSSRQPCASLP